MIEEAIIVSVCFVAAWSILRIRDVLYKRRNYTVNKYEDLAFCLSFAIGLLVIGLLTQKVILIYMTFPFIALLLGPVIIFSMKQWNQFLSLLINSKRPFK